MSARPSGQENAGDISVTPAAGPHTRLRIEKHLAWRSSQGQKKATLEAVTYCLTAFEAYCQDRDLHDQVLKEYQQHLLWTPCSNGRLPAPATVDQHLRLVRAFLRHLFRDGVLELDSTADLVLPRPRSRA